MKSIKKYGPIRFYVGDGIGWFRLFGVGLHWKDTTRHPLLFSERQGLTKALKIRAWRIAVLSKNTP
jgi:hypothetical protein